MLIHKYAMDELRVKPLFYKWHWIDKIKHYQVHIPIYVSFKFDDCVEGIKIWPNESVQYWDNTYLIIVH